MPRQVCTDIYQYDELPTDKAKEKARQWFIDSDTDNDHGIKDDFTNTLEEAGFTDVEPQWSLGYCQGDGASFSGRSNLSDLIKAQIHLRKELQVTEILVDRYFKPDRIGPGVVVGVRAIDVVGHPQWDIWISPQADEHDHFLVTAMDVQTEESNVKGLVRIEMRAPMPEAVRSRITKQYIGDITLARAEELLAKGVSLNIKVKQSGRYVHWNSMNVEIEVVDYGKDDADFGVIDNQINLLQASIEDLTKELSRLMEKDGYAAIEGDQEEETVAENIRINNYWFLADGRRNTLPDPDDKENA